MGTTHTLYKFIKGYLLGNVMIVACALADDWVRAIGDAALAS